MKNWKAIVSITVVFLLGVMAGAIVEHTSCRQRMDKIIKGEPGAMREFIVQRLNKELNLDPGQLEQLRTIIKETHAEMKNLRRQIRPQTEEVLARSQDRVRSILRPDQLEKYERIIAERRKKRENREQ
jgi:hypothetical protein